MLKGIDVLKEEKALHCPTQPATEPLLVAALTDAATGSHRALLVEDGDSTLQWRLNGCFVRSFRFTAGTSTSAGTNVGFGDRFSTAAIEHAVFTRFKADAASSSGSGDGEAYVVALCVFRTDMLNIYYHSGESFSVSLPFGVRSVHAIQTGLLVQRRSTDAAEASMFTASLPTLFSLSNPRSEFKMLGINRNPDLDRARRQQQQQQQQQQSQRNRQSIFSPAPSSRRESVNKPVPVFNDPNITLIDTATGGQGSKATQYVLCWDSSARRYVVYQCTFMDPMFVESDDADSHLASTSASDTDFDMDIDLNASTSSLTGLDRGAGPMSVTRSGMGRQASLSVQRRSSAAVSAAAIAAVSRRKSGYGSAVKSGRRSSSMLGRVSFNDSPGPNYAVDIFREQRQMRAEVVLHMCWKERRQRSDVRRTSAPQAQICVIQAFSGSDLICVLSAEIGLVLGLDANDFSEVFRHSAKAIASVCAIRQDLNDLLILTPTGNLVLALGYGGGSEPIALDFLPHQDMYTSINFVEDCRVSVDVTSPPDIHFVETATIHIRVSRLATAVMDSLSAVLSRSAGPMFRRTVVAAIMNATTASEELDCLKSLLVNSVDKSTHPASSLFPQRVNTELRERASAALFALQLVYEDAALYRSESQDRLASFGQLLLLFARQYGLAKQFQQYLCLGFTANNITTEAAITATASTQSKQKTHCSSNTILPSFYKWVLKLASSDRDTRNQPPPQRFPSLASIEQLFNITDAETIGAERNALKLLNTVAEIFFLLSSAKKPTAMVLEKLASGRNPPKLLLQLTLEMQWLLRIVFERMRDACTVKWPPPVLALLGRNDMIANSESGSSEENGSALGIASEQILTMSTTYTTNGTPDIVELCEGAVGSANSSQKSGGSNGGSNSNSSKSISNAQEVSRVAFSRDLRIDEMDQMLQIGTTVYVRHVLSETQSPDDADAAKSQFMNLLARRSLALPLGRAAFSYSSQDLNLQDALPIVYPRVAARFLGSKLDTVWTAPGDINMSWPLFHSGVLATLSLDRDQARSAHPSWVLLNWPTEQSAEYDTGTEDDLQQRYKDSLASHAGFLFGMGLISNSLDSSKTKNTPSKGPLSDIPPWQAFKYLSIRHGLTSIALLMGCACAHRGSMDASVSKILSLHIPTLLPPGSSELMLLSHGTQAAAILGLGLLYMGSQNRRMSEVMLNELSSIRKAAPSPSVSTRLDGADPAESTAECYSLAAGFALGLVVLGQGLSTNTLADLQLLDALSEIVSGSEKPEAANDTAPLDMLGRLSLDSGQDARGGNRAAAHVSEFGAVAALGLIFLGTNYRPAAQRLLIPTTAHELRSADPLYLLWKTLMHSLIMLDSISSTTSWVEGNMPSWMPAQLPADLTRARLHIVVASCFAIGLKYAGTEDRAACTTILAYLDEVESIAARPALGYESSLTRASAQSCLDTMCIAAALVMAGTGDVDTMRRLRVLHSVNASRTYGNHMAIHLALGLLLLGGGARFTISRSLESIALLLIAFFPRYPRHYSDNQEHLQAWRHLWALCVQSRCLVVRSVVDGSMCRDAILTVESQGPDDVGSHTITLKPPVPFPCLTDAKHISVQAPGYIPLKVDVEVAP
ncbi:Anaphase-promoting complex subunit 1, partial [Coemansia sp. Benny D115]